MFCSVCSINQIILIYFILTYFIFIERFYDASSTQAGRAGRRTTYTDLNTSSF